MLGRSGFLSILHTWGQTLQPHPHIHSVVPGGGLSPDHTSWISSPAHFFLPVKVLSRVFRGKFVAGLRRAFHHQQLAFYRDCLALAAPRALAAFLRTLFQQDWFLWKRLVPSVKGQSYPAYFLPSLPIFNRPLRLILCSRHPFPPTTIIENPQLIAIPPRQRLTSNSIETAPESALRHSSSFICRGTSHRDLAQYVQVTT
jgi:Putative transposase